MSNKSRTTLFTVAFTGLFFVLPLWTYAADTTSPFLVTLHSGRTLQGHVDSQTDDEFLVLSLANASIQSSSFVRWDRIATVRQGEQPVSLDELRERLPEIAQEFNLKPAFGGYEADGTHIDEEPQPDLESTQNAESRATEALAVASISISSQVSNWDGDVERDGLLVDLYPLSTNGKRVPVNGQLECKLIVQKQKWQGGEHVDRSRDQFTVLERWNISLKQKHYEDGIATVKLPFKNRHPEAELDVDSDALLFVRLSVPGKGVFEASDETVRLRPYSAIREELQLYRGNRYFPQERIPASRF